MDEENESVFVNHKQIGNAISLRKTKRQRAMPILAQSIWRSIDRNLDLLLSRHAMWSSTLLPAILHENVEIHFRGSPS